MKQYIKSATYANTILQNMLDDAKQYIGGTNSDFLSNIMLQFDEGEDSEAIEDVIYYDTPISRYDYLNLGEKFVEAYINADKC